MVIKLQKFFLFFLLFFSFLLRAAEICAEGIGCGATKQDALHDAMRKAIANAVGMYVTTRTELKDDDYKEKIIISSDATITNYTEIESGERNGIWVVKINAKILPNELQKYCPRLITQEISSTDIGNLLNRRNAIKNADESLNEIFQDYYLQVIKFQKKGGLRVASNDDLSSDNIMIQVDFVASIDNRGFDKFQSRLCALLDKMALQKAECILVIDPGKNSSRRSEKWQEGRYRILSAPGKNTNGIPEDMGFKLWQKAGLKDSDWTWNSDFCFIAFKNYHRNRYTLYLVPRKIHNLIQGKVNSDAMAMICSLSTSDQLMTKKYFFRSYLQFYEHDDRVVNRCGFRVVERGGKYINPWTFSDQFNLKSRSKDFTVEMDGKWCSTTNGSIKMSVPEGKVKCLREIYIYPLSNFVWEYSDRETKQKLLRAADEVEEKFWHKK